MANSDFVRLPIDMRSIGSTGLRQYGGFVRDEILPELTGIQGQRVYREMVDNDSTIGGIMFIIDTLVRMVPWRVEEASSAPFDLEAAEFLESNMDDMDQRWGETICEMMSMVPCGYSLHEILYKQRCGGSKVKAFRSKYRDGRYGWRGMPIRSQDTIRRWVFDKSGDAIAAEQVTQTLGRAAIIPLNRCLHLRARQHKNNPEGRSALRSCYRAWYKKQVLENIEGVGAERDLAGLPVLYAPEDVIAAGMGYGTPQQAAMYQQLCTIGDNVRQDQQVSIILPSTRDDKGNPLFDMKLMASAGSKQFDTDKVIQRWDNRIAVSLCADFILMGQSSSTTGSFAMHTDKSKLFARAIGTFLDIIRDALNDVAVPELFRINDFKTSDYPRFEHGKIEQQDLKELGDFLTALTSAGMPLFPNPALEDHVCDVAGIPKPMDMALPDGRTPVVEPSKQSQDAAVPKILHDEASLEEEPEVGAEIPKPSPRAAVPRPMPDATDRLARAALSAA